MRTPRTRTKAEKGGEFSQVYYQRKTQLMEPAMVGTHVRNMQVYRQEMVDGFVPKSSVHTRHIKEFWHADNDTWLEIEVFTGEIDKHTCQPIMRSLFYSLQTQLGYWDEPPTGASRVICKQRDEAQRRANVRFAEQFQKKTKRQSHSNRHKHARRVQEFQKLCCFSVRLETIPEEQRKCKPFEM